MVVQQVKPSVVVTRELSYNSFLHFFLSFPWLIVYTHNVTITNCQPDREWDDKALWFWCHSGATSFVFFATNISLCFKVQIVGTFGFKSRKL